MPSAQADQEWLVAGARCSAAAPACDIRISASAIRARSEREVPVGTKMPPRRELARRLSIGRTTTVSAYNLLRAESLIAMKQGAGTWVVRRP